MCIADMVMTDIDATQGIVDFASASAETSVSQPAEDRLIAGSPQQRVKNFFSDRTGRFFAGVWESTPGTWKVRYSENEFCYMLAGRVRIVDAQGQRREFGPGDSFVIPAGFEGTWEVVENARKLYAIFEP